MPADRRQQRTKPGTKSIRMRDVYGRMLRTRDLTDQEIDDIRLHVLRLAQALCEHVWGKRYY